MATNWFLGLVASGFPVSGPQVPHNFCFHLQTQAENFLSSTSTWINPLAKLVFTWAYRMIEPSHPYEGHFASCSHIIICLYGDLHVITCIQLHFPITTSRPWGEGGSPGVTGLPQGPQQQPSPKDGWQAIPDGTGLQPKGYVQHMICLDMKNAYLFSGFQGVRTTKSMRIMCPMFGLTGTILQWHIEVFSFLLKTTPEYKCTCFPLHLLIYSINNQSTAVYHNALTKTWRVGQW